MDADLALGLGATLALLAATAFLSAAAVVEARRPSPAPPPEKGWRVTAPQLGIAACALALGWVGAPPLARALEPLAGGLGLADRPALARALAAGLVFLVVAWLHAAVGRAVPSRIALARPEAVEPWAAGPLRALSRLIAPALRGANAAAGWLVRAEPRAAAESGDDAAPSVVREIMTPRPDIVSVPADAGVGAVLEVAAATGLSRLPVTEESLDEVVGVVVVKDLLAEAIADRPSELAARDVMREAVFVPDSKAIDDLLAEMRARKTHIAIVVDEFGGTDGIVTLEDILEEIVGEIYDEHDEAGAEVEVAPDGSLALDGGVSFADLAAALDVEPASPAAAEEEYDTAAGYVMGALGRMPVAGDRVALGGAEVEVAEIVERRITRLLVRGADAGAADALRDALAGEVARSDSNGDIPGGDEPT